MWKHTGGCRSPRKRLASATPHALIAAGTRGEGSVASSTAASSWKRARRRTGGGGSGPVAARNQRLPRVQHRRRRRRGKSWPARAHRARTTTINLMRTPETLALSARGDQCTVLPGALRLRLAHVAQEFWPWRRLVRNRGRRPDVSEATRYIAMGGVPLRRIAHPRISKQAPSTHTRGEPVAALTMA